LFITAVVLSSRRPALAGGNLLVPPPSMPPLRRTPLPPGAVVISPPTYLRASQDAPAPVAYVLAAPETALASGMANSAQSPVEQMSTEQMSTAPSVIPLSAIPGNQPCTVNGASQTMTNHGTPSILYPKISLIYWGNWNNSRPFDTYWSTMASTPAFYNRLREYGASTGTFRGSFTLPTGATGQLSELTLAAGVQQAIGPYIPTSSDVLIVLLPPGTSSLLDAQQGFGGHHSSYTISGQTVPWGEIEFFADPAEEERRSSHEVFEMITDLGANCKCTNGSCSCSNGAGWWGTNGDEIGDLCNGQTAMIAGQPAQKFWSEAACRCVSVEDLNNDDCLTNGRFCRTVWRVTNDGWYAQNFSTIWLFGSQSALESTGDYNGDGTSEFASFAPSSHVMSILNINTGIFNNFAIGTNNNDETVPGDYDGDGKTDIAVWNFGTGNWTVILSSTGATQVTQWGLPGDTPVAQDYDGDGKTDRAVFRVSTQQWFVLPSNGNPAFSVQWGIVQAGDQAIGGDFNGDGDADFAIYRFSTGTWFVTYANTSTAYQIQFGGGLNQPIGRDVDGDWITDLTVWNPSNGVWSTIDSSTWGRVTSGWGTANDTPIRD
jgi:hypothetical protein